MPLPFMSNAPRVSIIFHRKNYYHLKYNKVPPPPHPTMKFNHFKLLLSTAAVVATAPLASGQVSFAHSLAFWGLHAIPKCLRLRVYVIIVSHRIIFSSFSMI